MTTLPVEIQEQIIKYLPFEKIINLSNHVALQEYNPRIHTICYAIKNDYLSMVKWICLNQKAESSWGIVWCAQYNRLNILHFLHQKRIPSFTSQAINIASKYGNHEIVKFLYDNGYQHDSHAIDLAAENGHLEIVKWLYKHGNTGTPNAINLAAKNGHIEIVKFLHDHGLRCTRRGISLAEAFGHREIVAFLKTN